MAVRAHVCVIDSAAVSLTANKCEREGRPCLQVAMVHVHTRVRGCARVTHAQEALRGLPTLSQASSPTAVGFTPPGAPRTRSAIVATPPGRARSAGGPSLAACSKLSGGCGCDWPAWAALAPQPLCALECA